MTLERLNFLKEFLRDHLEDSEGEFIFGKDEFNELFKLARIGVHTCQANRANVFAQHVNNFNLKENEAHG